MFHGPFVRGVLEGVVLCSGREMSVRLISMRAFLLPTF
jgi:hypothetical protein